MIGYASPIYRGSLLRVQPDFFVRCIMHDVGSGPFVPSGNVLAVGEFADPVIRELVSRLEVVVDLPYVCKNEQTVFISLTDFKSRVVLPSAPRCCRRDFSIVTRVRTMFSIVYYVAPISAYLLHQPGRGYERRLGFPFCPKDTEQVKRLCKSTERYIDLLPEPEDRNGRHWMRVELGTILMKFAFEICPALVKKG